MLSNYFKMTWKVLLRQPFYTFITLFGITLTLTIMLLVFALVDHLVGDQYPEVNRSRSLYLDYVELRDSAQTSMTRSSLSYEFLKKWVLPLRQPLKIAIRASGNANTFSRDQRIKLRLLFTNAAFWEVLAFDFVEGRPYGEAELANQARVVVITTRLQQEYFGNNQPAVGQYLPIENEQYRIIGVVRTVPPTQISTSAEVYLPYNLPRSNHLNPGITGPFTAILLGQDRQQLPALAAEYQRSLRTFPLPYREYDVDYNVVLSEARTYFDNFIKNSPLQNVSEPAVLYPILLLLALLFMALPAINLINLNLSRTLERAAEISIRKAFGAPNHHLLGQFIFEHLVVALLGGLLALGLTSILLVLLNRSDWIPEANLSLSFSTLLWGLLATIVFGLLAGVYPAYRMSRLNLVEGLKA